MKSAQRCSTCIEIAHPRLDESAHGWPAASINEPLPPQDNDSRTLQGLREARLLSPLTPFQSMAREGVGERKASLPIIWVRPERGLYPHYTDLARGSRPAPCLSCRGQTARCVSRVMCTIAGDGTCDARGIERVSDVNVCGQSQKRQRYPS
jgi:hypothetical protein